MPQIDVTTTVAQPIERLDLDAVKLAAKKTVVPGATDTHGCQVLGVSGSAAGTTVVTRVIY